ncbi:hypothetical protein HPB48_023101 [Haemaphysalis longicornis]|uniref:Uncharacterized protein n=1 Tax=Haemaphysalis longicornis TaxID=44386 RepID=A0A9J6G0H3_HAELO|nr:hypothetical protein HPB48_023101 [Haemaphysalis longicornis]
MKERKGLSSMPKSLVCCALRASDMEVVTVLRCMLCLLGAVATAMAWSVESVYRLWALSSDLVYVLLFPQFVALYFLRSQSNAYGAVIGFLVGIVARVACGEPQMGVPVLLKLPLYDVERGQLFPFRTLCMLLSLGSLLGGSHLAASVFQSRRLPDVWHCFTADTLILYCPPNSPAAVASPIVRNIGDRASAPFKYSASQTVVSSGGSDETPKQEPKTATLSLPETVPTPSAAQLESSPTPTPQQSPADIDKPKKKRKRPKDGESKSNGGGAKSTSSSAPSVQNEAVKLEAAAVPKGGPAASADPDKKSREARRPKGATPKGSARSQKTVGGGIVGSNDGSMVCKEYNNPKETGKKQMPAT